MATKNAFLVQSNLSNRRRNCITHHNSSDIVYCAGYCERLYVSLGYFRICKPPGENMPHVAVRRELYERSVCLSQGCPAW